MFEETIVKPHVSPRVLVIRRRYLGDLVLLGPVLRNLRLHYPESHIALLVDEKYGDVHQHNPDLSEILCIPQRRQEESYIAYICRWMQLLRKLRGRFDIVFNLTQNARMARLVRWTAAAHRVGYVVEGKPSRHMNYDVLATWTRQDHLSRHIVDICLKLLEADGITIATREVKLHVPASDAQEARKYLRAAAGEEENSSSQSIFVLVHPGARLSARCWPAEKFAAVCDAVQNQSQAKVLLVGGPGEEERVERVRAAMHTAVRILEAPPSVPKLAALLQAGDLFICNDSGPMHVASAVGTPVVALFGAQSTTLWNPAGQDNTVLQPSLPCDNCLFPGICRPPNNYKMMCIQHISTEEVIAAVLDRLNLQQALTEKVDG